MINKTKQNIARLAFLASNSSYNAERKREYQLLGRRTLNAIAAALSLPRGEYDIRWNPGGIAVSGDHILHTDNFYLALHDDLGMGWFYYRTCRGRKDYTGGPNQRMTWADFQKMGVGGLAFILNEVIDDRQAAADKRIAADLQALIR